MPKIKTHRGAAKRFSLTGSGKVKRAKAYKSHILNKKSTKKKKEFEAGHLYCRARGKNIKQLIPYK